MQGIVLCDEEMCTEFTHLVLSVCAAFLQHGIWFQGEPSDLIQMRKANEWQNIVLQNKSITLEENLLLGLVREIISSFPYAVLLPTKIDEEMNAQI